MSPLIILVLLGAVPLLVGLFLRVHTSALFLSIASGYLLALFVGDTASLVSRSFIASSGTGQIAPIVLFFIPIFMTMWLMRGSLGPAQIPLHFLPLVGCALLVLILGVELLPDTVNSSVYADFPGSLLKQVPDALVAGGVAVQLILMWLTARPRRGHEPHHRGHKK